MFSRAWEEAIVIREHINRGRPMDEIYVLSESLVSRLPLFMMEENEITLDLFLWR